MESHLNGSDSEDSLNIAAKDWNRITDVAKKNGYREGVQDGSDFAFQDGFDAGYLGAFHAAFILGKFKSLLNSMPQDIEHPSNVNEILKATRRGACYMCITDSQGTNNIQKSSSQIIKEQKTYSMNVLKTLFKYFQPYIEQLNISDTDILQIQNYVPEVEDN
ncbi:hypothetical protein WH47_00221 [Habropoda laboriosa]|uniref:Essential protein Yae1 N-terminal domain-containing protein n=1 Tax=Habropoda laboriosa TaxID=597456 RepID=A0A0L7R1K0_9HYME|nr:PREDICTED: uncharacterized protein LOC108572872 [Habropoda laboriosa]KOC64718.1 hypothetical protein WH47_00221 [Habropoda laboriosa]